MATNTNVKNVAKLSVMTLAIMNITAVVSLRGLPAEAEYGLSSAFYYLFAAIVFLIPTALVAAELASMFSDKQGGVFRWVGEALGKKFGFLAIFMQWIESTIWYPTVLTFGAVSIAFIGLDYTKDITLASNPIFTLIVVLAIYWIATIISLQGLKWVGKISKIGGLVGTIIPAALLIIFGIIYIATGGHNNMDMTQGFFPDFSKFDNIVLASSIFLFYAGMEMTGIHVMEVNNPKKNYPRAIFISAIATVIIFILGTFSLGLIIPAKDINLTQSLLEGFDNYLKYLHVHWISPIIAIALMFGVLAGVLTWVAGPSKGIFAVGKAGYLPRFFQKSNKIGVQRNILIIQGIVVTCLALLFVVMPSVQSFYQILSQLTVILYLVMYMLMFLSGIVLRYKMSKTERPYSIGKSNGWMWLVAGVGFLGALFAFILSFIPPSQIQTGSSGVWFGVLIGGCVFFVIIPFIIYALRKPDWKDPNVSIEPFHWETGNSSNPKESIQNPNKTLKKEDKENTIIQSSQQHTTKNDTVKIEETAKNSNSQNAKEEIKGSTTKENSIVEKENNEEKPQEKKTKVADSKEDKNTEEKPTKKVIKKEESKTKKSENTITKDKQSVENDNIEDKSEDKTPEKNKADKETITEGTKSEDITQKNKEAKEEASSTSHEETDTDSKIDKKENSNPDKTDTQ